MVTDCPPVPSVTAAISASCSRTHKVTHGDRLSCFTACWPPPVGAFVSGRYVKIHQVIPSDWLSDLADDHYPYSQSPLSVSQATPGHPVPSYHRLPPLRVPVNVSYTRIHEVISSDRLPHLTNGHHQPEHPVSMRRLTGSSAVKGCLTLLLDIISNS